MKFLWATRGKLWGFCFLSHADLVDPIPTYDQAFSEGNLRGASFWRGLNTIAFRFTDPLSRTDLSGRPILHEIVILDSAVLSSKINSVESGMTEIWPLIEEHYAAIWDDPTPHIWEQ
jgi:hypothetical protein